MKRQDGWHGSASTLLWLCSSLACITGATATLDETVAVDRGARFVDATNGDDERAGTRDAPWRTVAHGLSELDPGGTLVLRAGVYDEGNLKFSQKGDPSRWTTLRSFPGEDVVIDGSEPAFRDGRKAWELWDPATATYRSRQDGFGSKPLVGKVTGADGQGFVLVPYVDDRARDARGRDDLRSTVYRVSERARYVGPGIANVDGRLYIRLQPVPDGALHGRALPVPVPTDPNLTPLQLSSRAATLFVSGRYLRIEGLTLAGAKSGIELRDGARHVEIVDNDFEIPGGAVLMRDGVEHVTIRSNRIHGDFPAWVAWTDMKGRFEHSRPASYSRFKTSGGGGKFLRHIDVLDNDFDGVFDGMVLAGSHIRVLGNRARTVDDFVQLGSDSDHVEIAYNRILGAGPSHNGKGDSRSPGTTWVHHNVVDARHEILWGKPDPDGLLRSNYHGWRGHKPFPAHTASALVRGDPWKVYHNTLVFDATGSSTGSGMQLWHRMNGTGVAHEAYNNVLVEVGGGPFMRGLSLDAGPQAYAGNLYARPPGSPDGPLFEKVEGPDGHRDHASLQAFRRSSDHEASRRWQPAGWTHGSVQGPVDLDADYRPEADSAAARGAVGLPDDFPGPRSEWRGALAPR